MPQNRQSYFLRNMIIYSGYLCPYLILLLCLWWPSFLDTMFQPTKVYVTYHRVIVNSHMDNPKPHFFTRLYLTNIRVDKIGWNFSSGSFFWYLIPTNRCNTIDARSGTSCRIQSNVNFHVSMHHPIDVELFLDSKIFASSCLALNHYVSEIRDGVDITNWLIILKPFPNPHGVYSEQQMLGKTLAFLRPLLPLINVWYFPIVVLNQVVICVLFW